MFSLYTKFWLALSMTLIFLCSPVYAEKITVDREEYENLKKAVEYLITQQKEVMEKASRAEEKADEASEVAAATAEVVEDSGAGDALNGVQVGGYVNMTYQDLDADDSSNDVDQGDIHHFVVSIGKEFTENLRFFSELEVEHGGVQASGSTLNGEVEVEQAYVEYDYNDNAQVRGGVFLLPIGHLNESHEPPVFYGVQRPGVESIVIPSTWWEMGVGGSYQWENGFSADLAMHSGLDIPTTGSSFGRIRSGRQKASRANFSSHAYTGRLKYSGVQGLALSASFNHQTDASQDDADNSIIEDATLYALTAAYNRGPFGIRGLYAAWDIDGTIKDTAGSPDDQFGWYIEPSFKPLDWLGFYTRYEDVEGSREQDQYSQWELGLTWWPHPDVSIKTTYRDRSHDPAGELSGRDFDGIDVGIGYMFGAH